MVKNLPASAGDTGDLVEKKENPKGERAVKPVISLPSEKWVLKIGFLRAPPSSRAEGLLFLHGLESNPGSSLQTEEEAGLP